MDIDVKTGKLREKAGDQKNIRNELNRINSSVQTSRRKLRSCLSSSASGKIDKSLGVMCTSLQNITNWIGDMADGLDTIAGLYDAAEQDISGNKPSGEAVKEVDGGGKEWIMSATEIAAFAKILIDWFLKHIITPMPPGLGIPSLAGALTALIGPGKHSGSASYGGLNVSGDLDILGGSAGLNTNVRNNFKDGDVGVGVDAYAEAHLVQGKVEGSYGPLSGSVEGAIGVAAVSGSLGASLFNDGMFAPSVSGDVEAKVVGAEGSAKAKLGNDDVNAHVNAKGSVMEAKAYANGSVGVFAEEDESGNVTYSAGVKGKVGAEAYAAQGEVSGGIDLFGIKINATLEGKAGGAGVSAEGKATTGGVSGKIGAGLGLGIGIGISIDWSGLFKKR